jgi:hypothetical protein
MREPYFLSLFKSSFPIQAKRLQRIRYLIKTCQERKPKKDGPEIAVSDATQKSKRELTPDVYNVYYYRHYSKIQASIVIGPVPEYPDLEA